MGSGGKAGAVGNGQQGSGAVDLRGGSAGRAAQAGQRDPIVSGERVQGDLSGGATWNTSGHEDHLATIPDPTANDPLAVSFVVLTLTRSGRLDRRTAIGGGVVAETMIRARRPARERHPHCRPV
jgi:hypothetical protein